MKKIPVSLFLERLSGLKLDETGFQSGDIEQVRDYIKKQNLKNPLFNSGKL